MVDRLEIESLMEIKNGRQYEILLRLRELNQEAYFFMKRFGKRYKQSYHELWKEPSWKEAKILLKEYFTIEGNGVLRCKKCNAILDNSFTIHHETYNSTNIYTPLFVEALCSNGMCHERTYSKRRYKKRK